MKADILPVIGLILILAAVVFLFAPISSGTQQALFVVSLISGFILSTVVYARLEKRERLKEAQRK